MNPRVLFFLIVFFVLRMTDVHGLSMNHQSLSELWSTFPNDIGIDNIVSPSSPVCQGNYPVTVNLMNYGINTVTSCTINWNLNGVNQPSVPWTGNLAPGASTLVTLNPALNLTGGNYTFFVTTINPNGVSDPNAGNNSKNKVIQVVPSPVINIQPQNQHVLPGYNCFFSVAYSPVNSSAQWQISTNNGNTWSDLVEGSHYYNVNTGTLTINSASAAMTGYQYRCLVNGVCLPSAVSDPAILRVGDPVKLTMGSVTGCEGQQVTIPVTVQHLDSVTSFQATLLYPAGYLQYVQSVNVNPLLLSGNWTTTSSLGQVTLSWSSSQPVNIIEGEVCDIVFIYNSGNPGLVWDSITPGASFFTKYNGINLDANFRNGNVGSGVGNITQNPYNQVVAVHDEATFVVVATGNPIFQWQFSTNNGISWNNLANDDHFQGVDQDTLRIFDCLISMNDNKFRCLTYGCNIVRISSSASLSVIKMVITMLDTFAVCINDTVIVPIKVWNFDSIAAISLTLKYQPGSFQYVGYQNINPAFYNMMISNIISIHQVRLAQYTTQPVTLPPGSTLVEYKFKLLSNSGYLQWDTLVNGNCVYSDYNYIDLPGRFYDGLAVNAQPVINVQPVNISVNEQDTAVFSINATSSANVNLNYQWQQSVNGGITWQNLSSGSPFSGVNTDILHVNAVALNQNGEKYRCVVSGICNPVFSSAAVLTVNPGPMHISVVSGVQCQGDTVLVPLTLQNANDIGEFHLKLIYDPSKLSFSGYSGLNPGFGNYSLFNCYAVGDTIFINWENTIGNQGVNLVTGSLLNLKFLSSVVIQQSPISWLPNPSSYFLNSVGDVLVSVLDNGTVSVIAKPQIFALTTPLPANGHFCQGEPGVQIDISTSQTQVDYELYINGLPVSGGIFHGTGNAINLGIVNTPGLYSVLATNVVTGCSQFMGNNILVFMDLPIVNYSVTGGGNICPGGSGVHIGLSGSQPGVAYQLYHDNAAIANPVQGTGGALDFGVFTNPGNYHVNAWYLNTLTCNTTMNGTAVIASQVMNYNVFGNDSVNCGDIATITIAATGGTSPYTYIWSDGQSGATANFSPCSTSVFYFTVTDALGCQLVGEIQVYVYPVSSITGDFRYDNNAATPLSNSPVKLIGNGDTTTQTTTLSGTFNFDNINNGTYALVPSCNKPWGGVNSTDALLIMKHYLMISTLNGLRRRAADLDANNVINSSDAMLVVKRYIGTINSYASGDWCTETATVNAVGPSAMVYHLKGICFGDVDASYVPGLKPYPGLSLVESGTLNWDGESDLVVPVRVNQPVSLGAISLDFNLNQEVATLKAVNIGVNGTLLYHANAESLRIGWYSVAPFNLKPDDILCELVFHIQPGNLLNHPDWISLGAESSLGDQDGNSLNQITLTYPKIVVKSHDILVGNPYPNPASGTTQIDFVLPFSGEVNLIVTDMQRENTMKCVHQYFSAGNQQLKIDTKDIPSGCYFLRMEVNSKDIIFNKVLKLIIL